MREKKKGYVILFFVAVIFVILNSLETICHYNNGDSIVFNTVGKFWNEGKIPYIDLFDHKGPIILFINMLSWKVFGCEQGILFFQVLAIFFTLVFLFKIANIEIKSDKKCLGFTILTLLFLVFTYTGGNMTEEYCLPFITCTFYFQLKYLKNYIANKIPEHSYKYAFFYGISFAVCLLTRLTNAVSICVGVLVILIILLKEKKIKNIFGNAIGFIVGFLVIFLPFALYFAMNNAFYEFIEASILFNFKYATNSASWVRQGNFIKNAIRYLFFYFPSYMILIIGMIKWKKERNMLAVFYILLGIFETILFMTSRLYTHYVIICLPNIIIGLMEIDNNKNLKQYQKFIYCLIIIIGLSGQIGRIYKFENISDKNDLYENLVTQIPDEEKNSFIAVDADARVYETYQICPYYRYFVLQDFQASNSEKLYQEIQKVFENGDVKWILFGGDIETTLIRDVLEKRYRLVDKKEDSMNVSLYRIKD